jgi:hypothetical protein
MEWYFTYHLVSEYAWRHGYIVRRNPAGYYWASSLDRRRILGSGTLKEAASWIRSQVSGGRTTEAPSLSEMVEDSSATSGHCNAQRR